MQKEDLVRTIENQINICRKCRLCEGATHAVPGEGSLNPTLFFIGEAPGLNEDRLGRPFVGRAGQLLDILLKEIGMMRTDVYITNIVKHRPPENRDPFPDEIVSCRGFLEDQMNIIQPKFVVTLGRFSYNYFFPNGKISLDHGNAKQFKNFLVIPLYHPAAALRNPGVMEELKKDFHTLPQIIAGKITVENNAEQEDNDQLRLI